MMTSSNLILGIDYDRWHNFAEKEYIQVDVNDQANLHALICGFSCSGKSTCLNILFGRLIQVCDENSRFYFADFKRDDKFSHLRKCKRYYSYDKTIDALDEVYRIMHNRQEGIDESRSPVVLIWDEYSANVLSLNKKSTKSTFERVINQVSEILMLGRSMNITIWLVSQRFDASTIPNGGRNNGAIFILLGPFIKSTYEMLVQKELIDFMPKKNFGKGEGTVVLDNQVMRFIKIPLLHDEANLKALCIDALNR